MFYGIYNFLLFLAQPFLLIYLQKRLKQKKELPNRMDERFGYASIQKPRDKKVIWIHVASVGESLSIAPLITLLEKLYPYHAILITSGTVTSAQIIEKYYPKAIHQFVPLDVRAWIKTFLNHWKPSVALFVESELWPNLIKETHLQNIPLILLNGRLSQKSFNAWKRFGKHLFKKLSTYFNRIFVQSTETQSFYEQLGVKTTYCGNLKMLTPLLPVNEEAYATFKSQLQNRPVWVAASTHRGEEEIILKAHKELLTALPNLLLILAPRHPNRGIEIYTYIQQEGLTSLQRSIDTKMPVSEGIQVYLADTIGELGLWYRLSPLVLIGGSFIPHGGHNPIEPAQLGCSVISGPHMENFKEICEALKNNGYKETKKETLIPTVLPILKHSTFPKEEIHHNTIKGPHEHLLSSLQETLLDVLPKS